MFLMKFARPNQKIRFGRMIASVGCSQCVGPLIFRDYGIADGKTESDI